MIEGTPHSTAEEYFFSGKPISKLKPQLKKKKTVNSTDWEEQKTEMIEYLCGFLRGDGT